MYMLKFFYQEPWIVVRSGTQTNCGGFAIAWGQAEYIEGERGVQIDWLDLGLKDDAKGVGPISGAVLREPFRAALQEGVELQYEKLALPKRLQVTVAKGGAPPGGCELPCLQASRPGPGESLSLAPTDPLAKSKWPGFSKKILLYTCTEQKIGYAELMYG